VYIGSLSKTLFPALRVGYLVADQRTGAPGQPLGGQPLAQALSRVKSLVTVNTPALTQAVVAQALQDHGGSLESIVAPKRRQFRRNRDVVLAALERAFAPGQGVTWNRPGGGFFVTVNLPFPFGYAEVSRCAGDYGVIVCPMQMFSIGPGRERQVRLSFSYVDEEQITRGVAAFAAFVRDRWHDGTL
jgi:(S)-3,5-dihydroxyphenylglycine transaminase